MPRRSPTTRLRVTSLEDRLTPTGGLDPTFGAGGIVTTGPGYYQARSSVLAQPDGHLIVVSDPDGRGTQLTRYNADGSLDTAFGVGGTVKDLVPGRTANLGSAVVGPDGKITLAGRSEFSLSDLYPGMVVSAIVVHSATVVRLNADGMPDTGFGTNGVTSIDATLHQAGPRVLHSADPTVRYSAGLLVDGSLVVTSDDHLSGVAAVKLTPGGAVDPTFGVNGLFRYPALRVAGLRTPYSAGSSYSAGVSVAAVPGGGVLLSGFDETTDSQGRLTDSYPVLLKLTPTGALDPSFDGDGVLAVPNNGSDETLAVTVQPDGKVLVGQTRMLFSADTPSPSQSVAVTRFLTDGATDVGFGVGGTAVAVQSGGRGATAGLALLPDGRIVVASGRYAPRDAGVAVLKADGTYDRFLGGQVGVAYAAGPLERTTVQSVTVSGDKVVVLGSFYSDYATYLQNYQQRLGLAVLTEGPAAIPLPPPPADPIGTAPVVVGPRDYVLAPPATDPTPPTPPGPVGAFRVLRVPGDINNDGVADKAVTDGSKVSVVSGKDGGVLVKPFAPFEASYTGTLNAVFVDIDNDNTWELVVSPGQGGGPVVAVYNGDGTERGRFWGIADPNFRGGVNLAAGDTNGDGRLDLVVTAGAGGGPRVAIFDGKTLGANAERLVADFFAFESSQTGGATAGVANGVLIFGAGAGGGPRVRGIDASSLFVGGGVRSLDDLPAAARKFDKFAGDPSSRQGVRLDFTGVNFGDTYVPGTVKADGGDGKPVTVYETPGIPLPLGVA